MSQAMARLDLDPHIYIRTDGELQCKPLLIVDHMSSAAWDIEELQLAEGAAMKLGSTVKPKLSSVDRGYCPHYGNASGQR